MITANANQERDVEERISVLGVVPPEGGAELADILSHTRWQLRLAHSIAEAIDAIRSVPLPVVLCEQRLSDGTWVDLLEGTSQLCPRPQIIVLSADAGMQLWAEVLNYGGYDLLARPLRPKELYGVVPMAWRQSKAVGRRKKSLAGKASMQKSIQTTAARR